MKAKKELYPFANWDKPILLAFVSVVFFVASFFLEIGIISLISITLLGITVLLMLISFFVLLFRREWRKAFYMFALIIAIAISIGLLLAQ